MFMMATALFVVFNQGLNNFHSSDIQLSSIHLSRQNPKTISQQVRNESVQMFQLIRPKINIWYHYVRIPLSICLPRHSGELKSKKERKSMHRSGFRCGVRSVQMSSLSNVLCPRWNTLFETSVFKSMMKRIPNIWMSNGSKNERREGVGNNKCKLTVYKEWVREFNILKDRCSRDAHYHRTITKRREGVGSRQCGRRNMCHHHWIAFRRIYWRGNHIFLCLRLLIEARRMLAYLREISLIKRKKDP